MKNVLRYCFTFIALLSIVNIANAQCKGFIKKRCMPKLLPYVHNGQLNSIDLFPGESASLKIPFHSGHNYRVMACGQEILEGVYFEVYADDEKTLLYTSKEKASSSWDFSVQSTRELVIRVYAPTEENPSELSPRGCVGLLIGFQEK